MGDPPRGGDRSAQPETLGESAVRAALPAQPVALQGTFRAGDLVAKRYQVIRFIARRLGQAAVIKGLGFLDAPMSGTSAMVERG